MCSIVPNVPHVNSGHSAIMSCIEMLILLLCCTVRRMLNIISSIVIKNKAMKLYRILYYSSVSVREKIYPFICNVGHDTIFIDNITNKFGILLSLL